MIQNKNIKLILNYFGGPLVFCILLYAITVQLHRHADWQSSLTMLYGAFSGTAVFKVIAVITLMFVNWSIEALKWQTVLGGESGISFLTSIKATFAGNALAFFTPNRTGEYFGRMLFLGKGKRISSIPLTIICSYAQVIVTLVIGGTSLFFMSDMLIKAIGAKAHVGALVPAFAGLTLAIAFVLTIFYFRLTLLSRWLKHMRWLSRWSSRVSVLEHVNATILCYILSLSVARYLVFVVQYFLLFSVFGVDVTWWQAFWSVSVVFLVIAVVPSMGFLSELGVRWQAGIQLVQLYSSNIAGIFATSMAIWMINLVIPALVGGALILALKLFDNKKDFNQPGFT